ncbi:MAG: hypothetical protein NTX61_10605 [Bacteroidetes bacterium]|nr:hypothetical protein [Bacteroidota bacterium]
MKTKSTLLICMIFLLNVSCLMAQCGGGSTSCMPVKSGNVALYFDSDVVINDL